ncbi:MAG: hypothetical protein FJ313_01155 [Gemmatimonadetes bacterium]|nr:hypothetical protein [Gemmatimonadota bacterium]
MGSEEAPVTALVRRIHAAPTRACLVVAGAGARALAWVLAVPGASRTVLDAQVPYSTAALDRYVGARAKQHVSAVEALAMADAAFRRARELAGQGGTPVAGVSCTAAVATDRRKRGDHRAHVAWRSDERARCLSVVLTKGARDRDGEEEVVSRLVLRALAEACGIDADLDLPLLPGECVEVTDRPPDERA